MSGSPTVESARAHSLRRAEGVQRVLHLIDQPGPGGAQQVCLDLAAGLDSNRFTSLVGAPGPGWMHVTLERRGFQWVDTPIRHGPIDLRYLAQLLRLIRRHRVDVIQTHLLGPGVYGSLAGLLSGIPVVRTFHGQVDLADDERFLVAKTWLLNAGKGRVVFVSEALRQSFMTRIPLRPERTAVIYNGIDVNAFGRDANRGVRKEWRIGDREFLVGAVGHLRPPKAYDVFLRSAAVLLNASPSYRFVVVGRPEGDVQDQLTQLERELGIAGKVIFAGFRSDLRAVMNALDVLVISSRSEGFSLSAVQAMACGLPVVSTRCGGPEEIVADGASGILVDVGSPQQIADAVQMLRNNPELGSRMGTEGRRISQTRFGAGAMVAAYECLYDELLSPGRV